MIESISSNYLLVDEIDRLCLAYEKSKDFLMRINSGIDQQTVNWQNRREIIASQQCSTSEFFLPKTQRINELLLEAVEALCRVELLIEQIVRIDLKMIPSISNPRSSSSFVPIQNAHSTSSFEINGETSIRSSSTARFPSSTTENSTGFRPITQEERAHSSQTFAPNKILSAPRSSSELNVPQSIPSLMNRIPQNYFQLPPKPQVKEKVKLQQIPGGTIWPHAKIDSVHSLSKFHIQNFNQNVRDSFDQMLVQLNGFYNELDESNRLIPLKDISIGDFGIAKSSRDQRWHRARCLMCQGVDQIRIVFIDSGLTEITSIDRFFPIEKSFTRIPAQAIACTLSEAWPSRKTDENDLVWPKEVIEMFQREVNERLVEVHFVNVDQEIDQWYFHPVRIVINRQPLESLMHFKRCIDRQANESINQCLMMTLSQQEFILFNIPIVDEDLD